MSRIEGVDVRAPNNASEGSLDSSEALDSKCKPGVAFKNGFWVITILVYFCPWVGIDIA